MSEGSTGPDQPLVEPLTSRELEILSYMAQHLTNREIADALILSLNTVKWYARQIYGKLGVDGRREAVSRARDLGLLADAPAVSMPPRKLPAQLTPFLGRQEEVDQICGLLSGPAARLLTIVGPGGMGKTRLAVEAAACLHATQAGLFPDLDEDVQPFFSKALEAVGRGAGLKRSASENRGARCFHLASDGQRLLLALHGTRPGDDAQSAASDDRLADPDHRILAVRFPTDQLIGPGDRDRLFHAGQDDEPRGVDRARIAQHTDRCSGSSGDRLRRKAHLPDDRRDPLDLLRCGPHIHDH